LILTGVPVPALESWATPPPVELFTETWKTRTIEFFLRSHLIHDVSYRILLRLQPREAQELSTPFPSEKDLILTGHILQELKKDVSARNAELTVFFIPSKREIELLDTSVPYQTGLVNLCNRLAIRNFDLAPEFKQAWLRCYYRQGMHWNRHGNRIAAQAIYKRLAGQ
jgi:hypothetical protein